MNRPTHHQMAVAAESARPLPSFLAMFDDQVRGGLLQGAQWRDLQRREMLYHHGDPSTGIFTIEAGGILLFHVDENGQETGLDWIGPGGVCGLEDAVSSEPYNHSARATVRTGVYRFLSSTVCAQFSQHTQAATALALYLSARLHRAEEQALILRNEAVEERVRRVLKRLVIDAWSGDTRTMIFPLAQADLAALVGASRQSTNKSVKSLERRGAVALEHMRIFVTNTSLL